MGALAQERPEVAGLPTRILAIRDQKLPATAGGGSGAGAPGFDVSVNYVPVTFPGYAMARISMAAGATEFWRVINAGADTILDLQVGLGGMGHATGCDIGSRGCSRPFHSYA